jgi:hypothetical protein
VVSPLKIFAVPYAVAALDVDFHPHVFVEKWNFKRFTPNIRV